MESEFEIESTQEAIQSTISSSLNKSKRKTISLVYDHCRPNSSDEPERNAKGKIILRCKHCDPSNSYESPVITNFKIHLQKAHSLTVNDASSSRTIGIESVTQLYNKLLNATNMKREELN